jgi:hypothetical protein
MAKRGRPFRHVWGEDLLADIRHAVDDSRFEKPTRGMKRGELKGYMASDCVMGRSQKWARLKRIRDLLKSVDRRIMWRIARARI